MGYDLTAKNKDVADIRIGAFSWPIILQETGAGYILGYGASKCPAQYVYHPRGNASPASNDGFRVTSSEAKMMAKIVRGFISVKKYVNNEWDEMDEMDRKRDEWTNDRLNIYVKYTGDNFMDICEKFADFAEKSGGFRIF